MIRPEADARRKTALSLMARGWTQARIARVLGVSRQRVHQIVHLPGQYTLSRPDDDESLLPNPWTERLSAQRDRLHRQREMLREQRARFLQRLYRRAHPRG